MLNLKPIPLTSNRGADFEFETDPVDEQVEVQILNLKLIQSTTRNLQSILNKKNFEKRCGFDLYEDSIQRLEGDGVDRDTQERCGFSI